VIGPGVAVTTDEPKRFASRRDLHLVRERSASDGLRKLLRRVLREPYRRV